MPNLGSRLSLAGEGAPALASSALRYRWPSNALFSVLADEVALALAGGLIARCSVCGVPFAPGNSDARKARAGRRAFCSDECRGAAEREKKRAWARAARASTRADSGADP